MSNLSAIRYPAVPLTNVFLHSGFEILDEVGEKTVRYSNLKGLSAAILYSVVTKPARLSNTEFVYLRKKLDLSQLKCAELLGVKEQTLSLWERNQYSLPIATDALFRRICIEELGNIFPTGAKFPRTVLLARLVSPITNGKYECNFDLGRWNVLFAFASKAAEVPDPVIALINNPMFDLEFGALRVNTAGVSPTVAGQIYGTSTSTLSAPMAKSKILIFGRVTGQTVEMNPPTKALYRRSSGIASIEGSVR